MVAMKKTIIIAAFLVAVLSGAVFAQTSTKTVNANVSVINGGLTLGNPSAASITFPDIYLDNYAQNPAQYAAMNPLAGFNVVITEARSGSATTYGWNLTMQASNFPAGLASFQSLSLSGIGASNVTHLTGTGTDNFTYADGPINNGAPQLLKTLSQADTNVGTWRFTLNPANIVLDASGGTAPTAGAYSSTITMSLTAGP